MTEKNLWIKVLCALFLGAIFGVVLQPSFGWVEVSLSAQIVGWLALPGMLFLGVLKMVAVPLVLAAVVCGVAGAASLASARRLGGQAVAYFLTTTTVAVSLGAALTVLLRPGRFAQAGSMETGASAAVVVPEPSALAQAHLAERLVGILPTNPFSSLADGAMLQIVIFASVLGAALLAMKADERTHILTLFQGASQALMQVVQWVLKLAPLAVFGLICKAVASLGEGAVLAMLAYTATVILCLLLMAFFHFGVYWLTTGNSPIQFIKQVYPVWVCAFSTSSSAATMPVTLRTAETALNLPPSVARFTIPLGTTVNMDGTALYQTVATVFLAQVFAVDIGVVDIMTILLMAIAASVGTPGLPGVGIVVLASILLSVGIPPEGIALIVGVDRLLDMFRTTLNVNGDLVAASVLSRFAAPPAASPATPPAAPSK